MRSSLLPSCAWICGFISALGMASSFAVVSDPVFAPSQGYFSMAFPVTVTCATPEATIHYTLNGNEPSNSDPVVTSGGSILIQKSLTLNVKAFTASEQSATVSAQYVITGDISVGGTHVLLVHPKGMLLAVGQQNSGRLGNGKVADALVRSPQAVLSSSSAIFGNAVHAAAGVDHSLALDTNNNVWSFGSNSSGQLGDNSTTTRSYPVRVLKSTSSTDYLTSITRLSAGTKFSVALTTSGGVYAWGDKSSGALGSNADSNQKYAKPVLSNASPYPALSGIKGIAAGSAFGFAREAHPFESSTSTGKLWAWGLNSNGQLGIGTTSNASRAARVKLNSNTDLTDVLEVSAGATHTATLRWKSGTNPIYGEVWCFGSQADGKLGNGITTNTNSLYPLQVKKSASVVLDHIIQVSAGHRHTLALDDSGQVWAWGYNASGELGDGSQTLSSFAIRVKDPSGSGFLTDIVYVAAGGDDNKGTSFAVKRDGTLYSWGSNANGQLGNPTLSSLITSSLLPNAIGSTAFSNRAPKIKLGLNQPDLSNSSKVRLVASTYDLDGLNDISQVKFYRGNILLEAKTSPPWICDLQNLASGEYADIKAVAVDSEGEYSISESLTFNVPFGFPQVTAPPAPDWDLDGIVDNVDDGGIGDWSRVENNDVQIDPDGLGLGSETAAFLNDPTQRLIGRWDFEIGSTGLVTDNTQNPPKIYTQVSLPATHPSAGPMIFLQTDSKGCIWDGNTVPPQSMGIPSKGIHFTRDGSYAKMYANDFHNQEDQTWTMWIKFDLNALNQSSGNLRTLFSEVSDVNSTSANEYPNIHCFFDRGDRKLKLATYSGTSRIVGVSWPYPEELDDGKWHHIGIAFSDQSSGTRFWCDGVRIEATGATEGSFTNLDDSMANFVKSGRSAAVYVGRMLNDEVTNEQKLDAVIDRLRVYKGGPDDKEWLKDQNLVDLYYQDSDRDGLWDKTEIELSRAESFVWQDPSRDRDQDGLTDLDEQTRGTGIDKWDTDGDGLPDGWEVSHGYNPKDSSDVTDAGDADGDGITNGYERLHGLSLFENDSNLDKDKDGLSNLLEYTNNTNVEYFDTDGDLLPDGFEYYSGGCLNPKVANNPDADPDNDGLTNLDEYFHGTKPCIDDTDGDHYLDGEEVSLGDDPNSDLDIRFNPLDFAGEDINDSSIQYIGNLGVTYLPDSANYFVKGSFGDTSESHSERWKLNLIGKRTISKLNRKFGEVDNFKINLDSDIWTMSISHEESRLNEPEYNYCVAIEQNPGFIFIDTYDDGDSVAEGYEEGLLGDFRTIDDEVATHEEYWKTKKGYLIPTRSSSYSASVSGSDAVGPKYRKIGLNGRPLPDEKPEQEEETEIHAEETYVDAYDLSLHHDTSFISVQLGSSDLLLEANASAREATWSDRSGLKPHEELTSPFGSGWSSNLCSYIEITQTLEENPTDPISVNVVDEGGRGQRFATTNLNTFQPWPSSKVDKKTYLNELIREGDNIVLYKKFGNKLTYAPCKAWFMYSTDRLSGSKAVVKHDYLRLIKVEDRYGNSLDYNYGSTLYSLIPQEISSSKHAGQRILINRNSDGRRIDSITDPRNQTITFTYSGSTFSTLSSVNYPDGTSQHYTYEIAPELEIVDGKETIHSHLNLKSIQDKRGNTHTFNYVDDITKYSYSASGSSRTEFAVSDEILDEVLSTAAYAKAKEKLAEMNEDPPSNESGLRQMYGLPRFVSSVVLPGGAGTATFAKTTNTKTIYAGNFSASSGTEVTDAVQSKTFYDFGGIHGEIVDLDQSGSADSSSVSVQWMIYYTSMQVHHGGRPSTTGFLGTETFTYNLNSGLTLSSMTDMSQNTTNWTFGEALPDGSVVKLKNSPQFMSEWADPKSKTDALGRTETYEYGQHRVMTNTVDIHGTTTTTTVDSLGRRTDMTVTGSNGSAVAVLKKELYEYTNSSFPSFMTRQTTKVFSNLSGKPWEQDMVTDFVADSRGRLWKQIVNPGGLNLQTVYTYDLNNNKLTSEDPKGGITSFSYDRLNRIYRIDYPATMTNAGLQTSFQTIAFDQNGAKAAIVDENGHWTIYRRDALNRVTNVIRDIDGAGHPSANSEHIIAESALNDSSVAGASDIVSRTEYNGVSFRVRKIDARGFATISFSDALRRPTHVFTGVPQSQAVNLTSLQSLAASSRSVTYTELSYEKNVTVGGVSYITSPGASGFNSEGFKPTKSIRHNSVRENLAGTDSSFTTVAIYDEMYRPLATAEVFKTGASERIATISYGNVSGGKEPLVTTSTDPLGKVTKTYSDGLGRTIRVTEAFGTALEGESYQYYTSTGLAWKTVDELSRVTETTYDKAGRPTKVTQPDPVTGLISANSPVSETLYDGNGNVIAVIDPLTRRTDTDYDDRNRPWRVQQPAVTDATNADAPVSNVRPTSFIYYDLAGNTVLSIDPQESSTRNFYDYANRVIASRTNPSSGNPSAILDYPEYGDITTSSNLEPGGLVLDAIDGNGNVTRNSYDSLGRLIATITDPADGDPADPNIPGFTDESYRSGSASEILVTNLYDDTGNLIEVTDGKNQRTSFTYDGLARKTRTIWDPDTSVTRIEQFGFDALTQTGRIDAKNRETQYLYDERHRLSDVIYEPSNSDPSDEDRTMTYDLPGKLLSVTYPNELNSIKEVTQTFDKLDRLVSEKSAGYTHTYEYDAVGNRKKTTYGGTNRVILSGYDSLNRLVTLEERQTVNSSGEVTTYAYDRRGLITRKTLPNGNHSDTWYDSLKRTRRIEERNSNGLVSSIDYDFDLIWGVSGYDSVGNVRQFREVNPLLEKKERTVINTYDCINRLIEENQEAVKPTNGGHTTITFWKSVMFSYDKANNKIHEQIFDEGRIGSMGTWVDENGSHTADEPDAPHKVYHKNYRYGSPSESFSDPGYNSNQLIEYSKYENLITGPPPTVERYHYDENGNLVSRGEPDSADPAITYQWDHENRLIWVLTQDGDYLYGYDHRTRRVLRDESNGGGNASGTRSEISFSGGNSVQERISGGIEVEYVRGSDWGGGIGGILYTVRGGQRSYNGYNSRGDVVSTTDDTGDLTWQATYEAFGTRTEEAGENESRQRANTKDEDPTGLLNEGFRYRDLETGLFISRDPAGFVDGPNVYAYVTQNPWTHFDPLGLEIGGGEGVPDMVRGVLHVVGLFAEKVSNIQNGVEYGANWAHGKITGQSPEEIKAEGHENKRAIVKLIPSPLKNPSPEEREADIEIGVAALDFCLSMPPGGGPKIPGKLVPSASATLETTMAEVKAAKYRNLPDPKNVGEGKDFTRATKRKILEQNKTENGGVIKSDKSGTEAIPSQKSQAGVTPPSNEAQIDHIVPKSKGGTNSPSNAQVLTREENRVKSNN